MAKNTKPTLVLLNFLYALNAFLFFLTFFIIFRWGLTDLVFFFCFFLLIAFISVNSWIGSVKVKLARLERKKRFYKNLSSTQRLQIYKLMAVRREAQQQLNEKLAELRRLADTSSTSLTTQEEILLFSKQSRACSAEVVRLEKLLFTTNLLCTSAEANWVVRKKS